MGVLVSLGIGKPSLIAQYLTEMILIGLPSLVLGWLCARGAAQWLGTSALRSVNASAAKELSSMGQVGGDLESNMSVRTLDSLTVSIDTTAVLYVSLGLLAVMLVCVAISCIPMLRILVHVGVCLVQGFRGDELKHGVAKEFQTFGVSS